MNTALGQAPTTKQIILTLLSVSGDDVRPIARLVAAAALFGVQEATVRVTVGRLVQEGTLETVGRGAYRIGAKGRQFRDVIRGWSTLEELVRPWDGTWLLAHTAHLGRVERKRLKARERALRLRGFSPLEQGLWARPANLSFALDGLRRQLVKLGVEPQAHLFHGQPIGDDLLAKLGSLWDRAALERRYRRLLELMARSQQRLDQLPVADAARETLEIGLEVVTALNFDPLLPDEMVDTGLRREVGRAMAAYNVTGTRCWDRFHLTRERTTS